MLTTVPFAGAFLAAWDHPQAALLRLTPWLPVGHQQHQRPQCQANPD